MDNTPSKAGCESEKVNYKSEVKVLRGVMDGKWAGGCKSCVKKSYTDMCEQGCLSLWLGETGAQIHHRTGPHIITAMSNCRLSFVLLGKVTIFPLKHSHLLVSRRGAATETQSPKASLYKCMFSYQGSHCHNDCESSGIKCVPGAILDTQS